MKPLSAGCVNTVVAAEYDYVSQVAQILAEKLDPYVDQKQKINFV